MIPLAGQTACGQVPSAARPPCPDPGDLIDWSKIPVEVVPLGRFVISLNGIQLAELEAPYRIVPDEPVQAMSRGPGCEVTIYNGRHRVLRALLRGDPDIPARVLAVP